MTTESSMDPPSSTTKIMIVDDSVVVRGMLRGIIEQDRRFHIVSSAQNGLRGVEDYKRHKPDIVLMDIEMPEMDGMTALKEILAFDPKAKVIMCSSLTQSGAQITVDALRIGAVDCLSKPSSKTIDRSAAFEEQLLLKLRMLAKPESAPNRDRGDAPAHTPSLPALPKILDDRDIKLVPYPMPLPNNFPLALAIGSSTGGPKALIEVLSGLNKKIALPIFISQHIPQGFSKYLAENIQKHTGFPTHEAEQDMAIEAGHIYIAPGGLHMAIKAGAPKRIDLLDTPPVNFCKPSVDVMLESIAAHYGAGILTVILTGMGADGKNAAVKMATDSRYNIVIAQDKNSSVVWGMPGAVANAGICHSILPADSIADAINHLIYRKEPKG
ncbi:MAG: chemotaxis-specific protein-glutamate methyltransferase CheB [Micavibrio sp.]